MYTKSTNSDQITPLMQSAKAEIDAITEATIPSPDPEQIMNFAKLLLTDGDGCVEMRLLGRESGNWLARQNEVGFFNDLEELVKVAAKNSGYKTVYLGLNPRKSILLHAQPANQMVVSTKGGTAPDILHRALFPIDIDTKRESSRVAATDSELAAAQPVFNSIQADLKAHGIEPIRGMSGNGRHLLIPTIPYLPDPTIDEKEVGKASLLLKYFQRMYGNKFAAVDLSTFDLPRMWKTYGTVAIKGGNTKTRPWRLARFHAPASGMEKYELFKLYEREIEEQREIELECRDKPRTRNSGAPKRNSESKFWTLYSGDLSTLNIVGLFKSRELYSRVISGNKHAVTCPWAVEHTTGKDGDSSTVIFEGADKAWPGFKCQHSHCIDRGLEEVLDFFGRDEVDQHCSRAFASATNNRSSNGSTQNGNTYNRNQNQRGAIFIGASRQRSEVLRDGMEILGDEPCYSYDGTLAVVRREEIFRIESTSAIQALLNKHAEFYDEKGTSKPPEMRERVYTLYPTDHAAALLSSRVHEHFSRIRVFATIPVLGADYVPVALGYNEEQEIYRVGPEVVSKPGTSAIDEVLAEVDFDDCQADRANFIAMMLTALVHHLYPGRVPMLVVFANQRGVGKTLLVQILSIIRQGGEAATVTMIANDEELEKRLCSQARTASNLILLDNAKPSKNLDEISSSVLERSITDPILSYRILGKNLECKRINDVQFCLTTNGGKMSPDLISRMLPVRLFYEGDPAGRKFANKEVLELTKRLRQDILSELLGMFEVWRAAGKPEARVQHRFQTWAGLIGGVLEANGITGFLENAEVAKKIADPDRQEFSDLAGSLEINRPYTAKEIWTQAKKFSCFTELHERYKDERVAVVQFGRELTRFLNEKVMVAGIATRFVKNGKSADKTALYCFKTMPEQSQGFGWATVCSLRPNKPNDSNVVRPEAGEPEKNLRASIQADQDPQVQER
jgi:hypothetical protein